jgi:hypothetical protein
MNPNFSIPNFSVIKKDYENFEYTPPDFRTRITTFLDSAAVSFRNSLGNFMLLPSDAGESISSLTLAANGALSNVASLFTFGASETINDVANTSNISRYIFIPLILRILTIFGKKADDYRDSMEIRQTRGDFSCLIHTLILYQANDTAKKNKLFSLKNLTSRGAFVLGGVLLIPAKIADIALGIFSLIGAFCYLGKNDEWNKVVIKNFNSFTSLPNDIFLAARGFLNPSQTFEHKEEPFIVKEEEIFYDELKDTESYLINEGFEKDKSSLTDKVMISVRNLMLLPSEIGESINKIFKVFTGAIATLLSIIAFGQFEIFNNIANLTSHSNLILMHPFVRALSILNPKIHLPSRFSSFLDPEYNNPMKTFDKICGKDTSDEIDESDESDESYKTDEKNKAIYCGTLTYYTTHQIFKSAESAIHNKTSFCKRQFVSRALFVTGGLLSIITRTVDLAIGIITVLGVIFTNKINSFVTRNLCTFPGFIHDIGSALRGFVNPNQYYVKKDTDDEIDDELLMKFID